MAIAVEVLLGLNGWLGGASKMCLVDASVYEIRDLPSAIKHKPFFLMENALFPYFYLKFVVAFCCLLSENC